MKSLLKLTECLRCINAGENIQGANCGDFSCIPKVSDLAEESFPPKSVTYLSYLLGEGLMMRTL